MEMTYTSSDKEEKKNEWIGFSEKPKLRVVACNRCHRASGEKGVTLIKGKDSYYCIDCYMYLKNRGKQ